LDPGVGENAKNEDNFESQHDITKNEIKLIIHYTNFYKQEIKNILLKH